MFYFQRLEQQGSPASPVLQDSPVSLCNVTNKSATSLSVSVFVCQHKFKANMKDSIWPNKFFGIFNSNTNKAVRIFLWIMLLKIPKAVLLSLMV